MAYDRNVGTWLDDVTADNMRWVWKAAGFRSQAEYMRVRLSAAVRRDVAQYQDTKTPNAGKVAVGAGNGKR